MQSLPEPPREPSAQRGIIFDIRSYAIHDGPGVRTSVFFKGCPLACLWCCNPESQADLPELVWLADQCLDCGLCAAVCTEAALVASPGPGRTILAERCTRCGECSRRCPSQALTLLGRWVTAEEVLEEVLKDALYFEASGGGLTLTGGEPMAQADFAGELLWRYKHQEKGLHTAMETCGWADWASFQRLADDVDLFLYDIKHMDPMAHRRLTGKDNDLILENARRLAQAGHRIVLRLPLIPGLNDTEANLTATAEFALSLPTVERVDLLPYHRLGEPKYRRLVRDYPLPGILAPAEADLDRARTLLEAHGLTVQVGG